MHARCHRPSDAGGMTATTSTAGGPVSGRRRKRRHPMVRYKMLCGERPDDYIDRRAAIPTTHDGAPSEHDEPGLLLSIRVGRMTYDRWRLDRVVGRQVCRPAIHQAPTDRLNASQICSKHALSYIVLAETTHPCNRNVTRLAASCFQLVVAKQRSKDGGC